MPDPDPSSMRTVLTASYNALASDQDTGEHFGPGVDAQWMYRRLGDHPGARFSRSAAAAAADLSPTQAAAALARLIDHNLVHALHDGRYALHDRVQQDAAERSAHTDGASTRSAAQVRIITWYLSRATAVDREKIPLRWHLSPYYSATTNPRPADIPLPAQDGTVEATVDAAPDQADEPAAGQDRARPEAGVVGDWRGFELENLLASQRLAADLGLHDPVWQMCEALWSYLLEHRPLTVWISSHELGLAAARTAGNQVAEARVCAQLANAYLGDPDTPAAPHAGQLDQAGQYIAASLTAAHAARHVLSEATAIGEHGLLARARGDHQSAIAHFTASSALHRLAGESRGEALMLRRAGEAYRDAGHHDTAAACLSDAIDTFAGLGDGYNVARTRTQLAATRIRAGQPEAALGPLEAALTHMRAIDATYYTASLLITLTRVYTQLREVGRATAYAREAETALSRVDEPHRSAWRQDLDSIQKPETEH